MRLNIKRLFRLLGPWRWRYAGSALLLLLAIGIKSVEPKILQIAIDGVLSFYYSGGETALNEPDVVSKWIYGILPDIRLDNLSNVLFYLILFYITISIVWAAMMLISTAINASSTEHAIKHLRDRLFAHIQKLPLKYHNNMSTGELIQRSTGDVDTVRRFTLNQVVDMIRLTAIFSFAFVMMLIVNWQYALISVALVPLVTIGGYYFFKREGKVWEEHEKEADKLNAITQENLNNIRTVQAFAREKFEMDKFEKQNQRKFAMGIRHMLLHVFFWPISDFLVLVQITFSVVAGGYFAMNGAITPGELASFYTYLMMVTFPMRQLGRVLSQMGMATVAMGRIYDILEAEEEVNEGSVAEQELKGHIVFDKVTFGYKPDDRYALENLSLEIKAGEKVAIIGPSGSGKSTIIRLLTRFYEPDQGTVMLDGKLIATYDKPSLRKRIGVVLQRAFLFSRTLGQNVAYAKGEASEEEILSYAEMAGLDNVKTRFPEGLNTIVGEKGVTLSGGQKQRVSIARTLISEPDILVLDDVTSAVDTETEQAIFDALEQHMSGKTILIISHRLTSIQLADRIIVMDKGHVVQQGTHDELVKQVGYYKDIHDLQTVIEEDVLATTKE